MWGLRGDWPFCGRDEKDSGRWEQRKQKEENGVKGEADAAPLLNCRPPSEQGDPELGEEETGAPLRSLQQLEGCVTRGDKGAHAVQRR